MESKLGISQKAYSKIERTETKLDWDRILEISQILEVTPIDVIYFDERFIFNNCRESEKFIESTANSSFSAELKNQYEYRIEQLEKEIDFLKKLIENKL